MAIEFPNFVRPSIDSYSFSFAGDGIDQIELAGGQNRVSMSYGGAVVEFAISFEITSDNSADFDFDKFMSAWNDWYFNTSQQGTLEFDINLDSGGGFKSHVCTVKPNTYNCQLNNNVWVVSMTMLSSQEPDSNVYDSLQASYGGINGDFPAWIGVSSSRNYAFSHGSGLSDNPVAGGLFQPAINHYSQSVRFDNEIVIDGGNYDLVAGFFDWFYHKTNQGVKKFTMKLDTGNGAEDHKCRIVAGSLRASADYPYIISFQVDAERIFNDFDGSRFDEVQNPPLPTVSIDSSYVIYLGAYIDVVSTNANTVSVYWGDNSRDYGEGDLSHDYALGGTYTITVCASNRAGTVYDSITVTVSKPLFVLGVLQSSPLLLETTILGEPTLLFQSGVIQKSGVIMTDTRLGKPE